MRRTSAHLSRIIVEDIFEQKKNERNPICKLLRNGRQETGEKPRFFSLGLLFFSVYAILLSSSALFFSPGNVTRAKKREEREVIFFMILMTFTVPCYNSESYMRKCIDSLLPAGDDTEIIIVDDGSTDGTGAIADEYAAAHPDRVRVVHQENGGHGEGVNQGIRLAQGKYFKVVDSDDWLDGDALARLTARMREHEAAGVDVDMYVANYVYEHVADGKTFVMGPFHRSWQGHCTGSPAWNPWKESGPYGWRRWKGRPHTASCP